MSKPRWVRQAILFLYNWAGLNQPTPAPVRTVEELTAEELTWDMTPAEVMNTWRDTVLVRGDNPNAAFMALYRATGENFKKRYETTQTALPQVKWWQDYSRRQRENFGSDTRIDLTPHPDEIARTFLLATLEKIIQESK